VKVVELVDFGSTFTKVRLVEVGTGLLVASAQMPTSISSDVIRGRDSALREAMRRAPSATVVTTRAASSAGGGLRVAAIGLVPELTARAARHAALNAGGRVDLVLGGQLDDVALAELRRFDPDVVLFAGGTDGGQIERVVESAHILCAEQPGPFIVVACNALVSRQLADDFRRGGHHAVAVPNVMPRIGELNIEPARRAITSAFLTHVITGRGLSQSDQFHAMVALPTPEAVLTATELIANGPSGDDGFGRVAVVDIGGATTDVHSVMARPKDFSPRDEPLLPIPSSVRTVEGDLGVRVNSDSVIDADWEWLTTQASPDVLRAGAAQRTADTGFVPTSQVELEIDSLLARSCATHGLRRHCGELITSVRRNSPPRVYADGPDLRELALLIGTGGTLAHDHDGVVLPGALARQGGRSLIPTKPQISLDRNYILASAGLLAGIDPVAAFQLMVHELKLS
jgi:uncharacterized protein (TIGR01319 family)